MTCFYYISKRFRFQLYKRNTSLRNSTALLLLYTQMLFLQAFFKSFFQLISSTVFTTCFFLYIRTPTVCFIYYKTLLLIDTPIRSRLIYFLSDRVDLYIWIYRRSNLNDKTGLYNYLIKRNHITIGTPYKLKETIQKDSLSISYITEFAMNSLFGVS